MRFSMQRVKGWTECSLLKIEDAARTYEDTAHAFSSLLRQTDYLGVLQDGLYVLLPNTSEENENGLSQDSKSRDVTVN